VECPMVHTVTELAMDDILCAKRTTRLLA
jgi:hypothetical protein